MDLFYLWKTYFKTKESALENKLSFSISIKNMTIKSWSNDFCLVYWEKIIFPVFGQPAVKIVLLGRNAEINL